MFYAELNELLVRELAEDGYSGVEVRQTPMRTEIIIRATRTQNVLGESPEGVGAAVVAGEQRWQGSSAGMGSGDHPCHAHAEHARTFRASSAQAKGTRFCMLRSGGDGLGLNVRGRRPLTPTC